MQKLNQTGIILILALLPFAVYGKQIDRIVAIVNNDIVMNSELKRALKSQKTKSRMAALNKLIDSRLREQIVKNIGVEVTPQMIDDAVNQIAQQNNLSLDELAKALPSQGLSMRSLRARVKKEIEATIFQRSVLKGKTAISEAEIKKQIAKQPKSIILGNSPEYYHVEHILIAIGEFETPVTLAIKKQKAERVIKEIISGKDFAEIAEKNSDSPTAEEGGDLGWRLVSDYPELIAKTISSMQPGQTIGPIKDDSGFHIIRLAETEGGTISKTFSYEERKQQAMNILLQKKAEEHIEKILRRYRDEAYIEIRQ